MSSNNTPSTQQPSSQSQTVTLKVKLPPGHLSPTDSSTFSLGSIPTCTTIGNLRQSIHNLVPTNPAPERQRLLYGGRALVDNEQTIQDALNTRRDPGQQEYVVHLLVRGEGIGGAEHARSASAQVRAGSAPPIGEHQNQQAQGAPPAAHAMNPMQMHQQFHHQAMQQRMQQQMMPGQARQPGGMPMPQFAPFAGPHGQPMGMAGFQLPPGVQLPPGMPMPMPQHMQRPGAGPMMQQGQATMNHQSPQPNGPSQNADNNANTTTTTRASVSPSNEQQQPQHLPQDHSEQPQSQPRQHQQQHQQGNNPWQGNFHVEARGPNGERIQLHHQAFNVQGHGQAQMGQPFRQPPFAVMPEAMPGMPMIPGMPMPPPGMMPPQGVMGMPMGIHPPHQQGAAPSVENAINQNAGIRQLQEGALRQPSALDRARQNMAEMRRMLDEMRNRPNASSEEERTRRIAEMEERARQLDNYIDPLRPGTAPTTTAPANTAPTTQSDTSSVSTASTTGATGGSSGRRSPPSTIPRIPFSQRVDSRVRSTTERNLHQQTPSDSNNVTAYLLSSPQGPQAMLFSPQFGTYTGAFPANAQPMTTTSQAGHQHQGTQPTPTPTVQPANAAAPQQQPPADPVARAAAQHLANGFAAQQAAQQQAVAAGRDPGIQDPLAPIQPLLAHFWLLLRILIFAYFLLGSSMGYTRPMILAGICMVFWAIRMGALGAQGEAVRRWWEGVVGVPGRGEGQQGQQQGQGNQGQAQAGNNVNNGSQAPQQPAQANGRQPMPTPEQVAQRLLNEDAARREQRRGWLREQIRPVERAVALFVASLWPGVGEAHVRAQEQEQRRLAEEEVAARRRAEEGRPDHHRESSGGKESASGAGPGAVDGAVGDEKAEIQLATEGASTSGSMAQGGSQGEEN